MAFQGGVIFHSQVVFVTEQTVNSGWARVCIPTVIHFLSGQAGEGRLKRRTWGLLPVSPREEEIRAPTVVQALQLPTRTLGLRRLCSLSVPHTHLCLFLFYCWDLIPVELLLTKKLKELAQFQVDFLGAGSKNPKELTIHLVFLCWMLNGIPVVPRMAWCSRYLVNSQRTSQFAF